ncbi:cytochrome c, partial [Acinetobacter baumannii]
MNKKLLSLLCVTMGLAYGCGKQDEAPAAAAGSAPAQSAAAPAAAPAPAPAAPSAGEGTYKKVCAMCHASGVAGAPVPGK